MYFDWFDTVTVFYSYAGDSQEHFDDTVSELRLRLEQYHKLLDIYHGYEGLNNLYTLNRNAGGDPVKLDPFLIEYLSYCKDLYYLTGGELNVMMGSVLRIWHECRETAVLPSMAELEAAAEHISIENLIIDKQNCTAQITDPVASVDAGAVGKGFAAEKLAAYLKETNNSGYVVNIGGNLRLVGTKADGSDFITGIRSPYDEDELAVRISMKDSSCVTSGSYERNVVIDGKSYSHIIDRDTLMPADYYLSVSVITEDSALADGLATALSCMDLETGYALITSLEGVQAVWIMPDGTILSTEGVQAL